MSARRPYQRWHTTDGPYLRRLRLRLEELLGGRCHWCGATRAGGANLQFHHHLGRDYRPRNLSWSQRLHRYHAEIKAGVLRYLACDRTGNGCHERHHGAGPEGLPVRAWSKADPLPPTPTHAPDCPF